MFVSIYRLAIWLYGGLMRGVGVFHPKAQLWVKGREGLLKRLAEELPQSVAGRPVAWFHAASLGEFEQGRPVMEEFRRTYPDYFILLTFFSPSGYEVRKNYPGADYICYLPLDLPRNASEFIEIVKPQIAFFIKYEFWYYFLSELRKRNVRVVSFSAIFRPNQLFFKWYGGFYRNLLKQFDVILVQNKESVSLLNGIGVTSAIEAGDTRFDRVYQIAEGARELPEIEAFASGGFCIVVGSSWPEDRAVLAPLFENSEMPLRMIVAPHEISEQELGEWEKRAKTVRYSIYKQSGFDAELVRNAECLLIDNMGMLSSLYRYGKVAYVGGAFGSGLHNILEAVTFGIPVFFGNKNYSKFQEAVDLIRSSGAVAVGNAEELNEAIAVLRQQPEKLMRNGATARDYVISRKGATPIVMNQIQKLMRRKS